MAQNATINAGDEPLFRSAHEALVFAYNFSLQASTPMTPVAKLMRGPVGPGRGLGGLDGAGQAGIIRAKIAELGKVGAAIITARIAPRTTKCECRAACCSGLRPNREWADALSTLADTIRHTALAGCTSDGIMRREYVLRYFSHRSERAPLEELARKYSIDRHTVGAHYAKVTRWLRGDTRYSAEGADFSGMEQWAFDAITQKLIDAGIVGA